MVACCYYTLPIGFSLIDTIQIDRIYETEIDHSVIFLLCVSVSSFPSVHTQEEDWERKGRVFVHYGCVRVRVYSSLNGQMLRHSLTPCHDPSLLACRT